MLGRAFRLMQRVAYEHLWARRIDAVRERGLVTFTFDDAPASAFEVGGPILEGFGWNATYYVAPGLFGGKNELGPLLSESHLRPCFEAGHEIASHTYRHKNCLKLPRRELITECRQGAEALAEFDPRNFAYPFGRADPRVKRTLGRQFDSCRGIRSGINTKVTDLNDLRSNAIYSNGDLEAYLRIIEETAALGGWLILYTHDVQEEPSRFGTTPGDLKALASAVEKAGLEVQTVRGALDRLRAGSP